MYYISINILNSQHIRYRFRITNKTEKKVKSLKGNITFTNKQGHEIKTFPMAYEEPIKGGEEVIWDTETVFDQFMDDEEALKNMDRKKLDCQWEPVQITYADGTTVK